MSCCKTREGTNIWQAAPEEVILSENEVHVWRATLNLPRAQIRSFRSVLAPEEHTRANRFRFEQDRSRFIAARGILRVILGRYLALEPDQILFGYGPQGKPELAGFDMPVSLSFNVTHSHGLALYAFAWRRRVGVDIERIDTSVEREQLARRFFSAREVAALQALPDGERLEGFFQLWTRKEAYVKARGNGLTVPLRKFSVPLAPGPSGEPLPVEVEYPAADGWYVLGLGPGPGYSAALVVEGAGWRPRCWQWAQSPAGYEGWGV